MFQVEHKGLQKGMLISNAQGSYGGVFHVEHPDPASERPMTEPAQPRVLQNPAAASHQPMPEVSPVPTADPTLPATAMPLIGSVRVLIQFDVCEEIRVDRLQQIINSRTVHQPSLKHAAPSALLSSSPPIPSFSSPASASRARSSTTITASSAPFSRFPSPATGTASSASPADGCGTSISPPAWNRSSATAWSGPRPPW